MFLETSLVNQVAISPTYQHAKNTGLAQLKSTSPGSITVLATISYMYIYIFIYRYKLDIIYIYIHIFCVFVDRFINQLTPGPLTSPGWWRMATLSAAFGTVGSPWVSARWRWEPCENASRDCWCLGHDSRTSHLAHEKPWFYGDFMGISWVLMWFNGF